MSEVLGVATDGAEPTPHDGSWSGAAPAAWRPLDAGPVGGPVAPRWVVPVIDRLARAQPTRVLGVDVRTAAIHRLRIERPTGYRFRPGQHAPAPATTAEETRR